MSYKHCCVIDKKKNYKEFVLVVNNEVQGYTLQSGEKMIDAPFPGGLVRPKWDGNGWQETATESEIEKAKAERPDIYAP